MAGLSEPQLILLGVCAFVIVAAFAASLFLAGTQARCCRICERVEFVSKYAGIGRNWEEPTLCKNCAAVRNGVAEYKARRAAGRAS